MFMILNIADHNFERGAATAITPKSTGMIILTLPGQHLQLRINSRLFGLASWLEEQDTAGTVPPIGSLE